jgi:Tfp pilus assembly protein PilZ
VELKLYKRRHRRLRCEAVIRHDNLLPDIFYNGKIYNLSKSGMYFESDQIIYPGEDILIGLKNSSPPIQDNKDHIRVEIKWRKELKNNSFRFGYGAILINPINTLIKSVDKVKPHQNKTQNGVIINERDPREHPRKLYRKVMSIRSKRKNYQGLTTNISRGGAYIMTKNKFYVGQMIQLAIPGDRNKKDIKLKGWVVRLSPDGFGVRFDRRTGRDRRGRLDRRGSL